MAKLRTPSENGTICPALINEDYDYKLSGDTRNQNCQCVLTDKLCIGMSIVDPDDQISQFFSRGKCMVDDGKLKDCPSYGLTADMFKELVKSRSERELNDKLNKMK